MIVYYDGHSQQEKAMSIHQRMTLDDSLTFLFQQLLDGLPFKFNSDTAPHHHPAPPLRLDKLI